MIPTFRDVLYELKFLAIFPLLDVLSTLSFVRRHSVDAEMNPIGRLFMNSGLGLFSYVIMYIAPILLGILLLFVTYTLILYSYEKDDTSVRSKFSKREWIYYMIGNFRGGYSVLYLLVLLNNFRIFSFIT